MATKVNYFHLEKWRDQICHEVNERVQTWEAQTGVQANASVIAGLAIDDMISTLVFQGVITQTYEEERKHCQKVIAAALKELVER